MPGMFKVHNALWFVHLEYLDYESLGMVPVAQVMLGWVFPSAFLVLLRIHLGLCSVTKIKSQ